MNTDTFSYEFCYEGQWWPIHSLHGGDFQDALREFLPWRKVVEWICIISCKWKCMWSCPTPSSPPLPVQYTTTCLYWAVTYTTIASLPGLHTQLLSHAVRKAGEGLDGFITWCMPRLTSCSVSSHLGLFSPLHSSFPEFSSLFLFSLSCESDCYWIDRG